MSDTTSIVITENLRGLKQATEGATRFNPATLLRWLESSGPLLRLATLSPTASDLVHSYRVTCAVAAASGAQIAAESYRHVRSQLDKLLKSQIDVSDELRKAIKLELQRSDALILEAGVWPRRAVVTSGLASLMAIPMTQDLADVLSALSMRMRLLDTDSLARQAYAKMLERIKPGDAAWASIANTAIQRATWVKEQFPSITRATYQDIREAVDLIDGAYMWQGKGELFEHFAIASETIKEFADAELRAATHRAAARGLGARAIASVGELRLGNLTSGGDVGSWLKFADRGVLIVTSDINAAAKAGAGSAVRVEGAAQATALFEFKAEKGISNIPKQQERALPRMVERWTRGEPVYVALSVTDEGGTATTRIYLLQPPDSKAGLSYYGVGTSNASIATREVLVKQGADTRNVVLDVSNNEMRALWDEVFWAAFDTLK